MGIRRPCGKTLWSDSMQSGGHPSFGETRIFCLEHGQPRLNGTYHKAAEVHEAPEFTQTIFWTEDGYCAEGASVAPTARKSEMLWSKMRTRGVFQVLQSGRPMMWETRLQRDGQMHDESPMVWFVRHECFGLRVGIATCDTTKLRKKPGDAGSIHIDDVTAVFSN